VVAARPLKQKDISPVNNRSTAQRWIGLGVAFVVILTLAGAGVLALRNDDDDIFDANQAGLTDESAIQTDEPATTLPPTPPTTLPPTTLPPTPPTTLPPTPPATPPATTDQSCGDLNQAAVNAPLGSDEWDAFTGSGCDSYDGDGIGCDALYQDALNAPEGPEGDDEWAALADAECIVGE
jgi:hypothetical protein